MNLFFIYWFVSGLLTLSITIKSFSSYRNKDKPKNFKIITSLVAFMGGFILFPVGVIFAITDFI